jgi:hypothetical protein
MSKEKNMDTLLHQQSQILYTSSEMEDVKQGEKDGNKHPSSQTDH